jgi:predicted kinase
MKTLYMTKGLPASGKSTWAREKVTGSDGHFKRVNKDDLRAMIDCGKWSKDNEKFLLGVRDYVVANALNAGKHVIVDDTNLAPKHETDLRALAQKHSAEFKVVDFTHVSLDECIARDKKRHNYVGEDVIRKMHRDFLAKDVPVNDYGFVYTHTPGLPECVLVDIDGTVAKMSGRSPYQEHLVHTDLPHKPVVELVKDLIRQGTLVIFMSGRTTGCYAATFDWLVGQDIPVLGLYMRAVGDTRDDRLVKADLFKQHILGNLNVRFVLDDRDKVVKMWRDIGLTCLQVAPGDF